MLRAYNFSSTMIEVSNKSPTFLVALIACAFLIASSYSAVPPLGDANCSEGSCDSANCATVDCTFGKLMDDPSSTCGCCKLCILYIGENEACGVNMNNRECGPGLICVKENSASSDAKCVKMDTACFKAQADYDDRKSDGSLGMYETRSRCDDNGDFVARKCQPGSSCYCVDAENNRIFGESPPNNATSDTAMNCECSRAYQFAAEEDFMRTVQFPHCLPNGNYDLLQCVNQACFCIDSVNQTLTSSIQPITAVTELPCYKADLHTANYFRPCEVEAIKAKTFINSYARQNIILLGIDQPDCSPDGYYQPLFQTKSTLYCADPSGEKIEHFEIEKESASAGSMNCKCARTRYWLTNQNLAKPFCCTNGNYRPVQCRGGVCFCVDSDGNQMGIEVQMDKLIDLQCYQQNQYPNC